MKATVRRRLRQSAALLISLLLLVSLVPAAAAEGPDLESYPNTWVNTGNQAADIVGVALTQVGYRESPDDHTKYNVWYYGEDTELAWCSIFISWCADQAGVETWVSCKNNRARGISVSNMEDNPFGGIAWAWGEADPQPGDIIYTAPLGEDVSTHTALVYQVDDDFVYTVEGNTKDTDGVGAVVLQTYYRSDGSQLEEQDHILFVVRPDYHDYVCTEAQEQTCTEPWHYTYVCSICGEQKTVYGPDAPGHSWDSGTLVRPVTAANKGIVCYTCTACGQTRSLMLRAGGSSALDVQDPGAWYYPAVLWAQEQGITAGTDSFHFSPQRSCSRSQAVTMLWRAMGKPAADSAWAGVADVGSDSSCYAAVAWAMSAGISSGTSESTFSPDGELTRAQAVTLLWRAAGAPEGSTGTGFTDVSPDAYYAGAIAWAADSGIISGITDTVFAPDQAVTRAQLVTMLWRQAGSPEPECVLGKLSARRLERKRAAAD